MKNSSLGFYFFCLLEVQALILVCWILDLFANHPILLSALEGKKFERIYPQPSFEMDVLRKYF